MGIGPYVGFYSFRCSMVQPWLLSPQALNSTVKLTLAVWRSSSVVRRMNEVTLR